MNIKSTLILIVISALSFNCSSDDDYTPPNTGGGNNEPEQSIGYLSGGVSDSGIRWGGAVLQPGAAYGCKYR